VAKHFLQVNKGSNFRSIYISTRSRAILAVIQQTSIPYLRKTTVRTAAQITEILFTGTKPKEKKMRDFPFVYSLGWQRSATDSTKQALVTYLAATFYSKQHNALIVETVPLQQPAIKCLAQGHDHDRKSIKFSGSWVTPLWV